MSDTAGPGGVGVGDGEQGSQRMIGIDARRREMLRLLWTDGRMSRWELHERTGVNPNAVGVDVQAMLSDGIVRECQSEPAGPGRPRVPIEIDPVTRHVVGVALSPGRVEAGRLGLKGNLIGKPASRNVSDPAKLVPAARALLDECLDDRSVAVGLSVTGFIDPVSRSILFSSTLGGKDSQSGSLAPLYDAAGEDRPVILENNMHALAAWWRLRHHAETGEDVLLVSIADGQLGAALLIDGRPNRGCAIGGNELGHTRFFVDTDTCYCGHAGCLERICSTAFFRRRGVAQGTLAEHAGAFRDDGANPADPAAKVMREILDYLSAGLANAANFIRPNRLVLVSELTRHSGWSDALLQLVRSRLLVELAQRVKINLWDESDSHSAETAGWLALASLYYEGWNRA
jgi:transcriptional regulator of PTS gene